MALLILEKKTRLLSSKYRTIKIFNFFPMHFTRIFLSGIIWALGFSLTVGVVHAANGGLFGDLLNRILASGNWETDTTGTVKNAEKLGGKSASEYVSVAPGQSCGALQCIYGFDTNGNVMCR